MAGRGRALVHLRDGGVRVLERKGLGEERHGVAAHRGIGHGEGAPEEGGVEAGEPARPHIWSRGSRDFRMFQETFL